jgi:hypothetical protein
MVFTEPHDPCNPVTLVESEEAVTYEGLTKREYFAAMALQGIIAGSGANMPDNDNWDGRDIKQFAIDAVKQANALVDALNDERFQG